MKTKTGVYVLEDGGGAMVTRAWLTEYAEETIDIQYFIFSMDNVGLIACDYLVRAADRGVKVRLLVDDIMVDADVQDILTLDSHENISIKVYNPGRMHNKTFIVDGKVVITGGRNIADEYFDYDHEYNFRDRDVLLLGKETKKRKIKNLPAAFPIMINSGAVVWVDDVEFVSDEPGKNDGKSGLGGGGISTSKLMRLVLVGMEEEFKPENAWETTLEYNPDAEVGNVKRIKTWTRKILPKDIL
ncbi:hypothetical protein GQR58_025026 [Nymphon striatum]|nr:hypothetical protein GQR58_025026 [Nymphon striatum]